MMTISPYTHMATSGWVPLGEAFATVANSPYHSLLSLAQKKIKIFIYHHTFPLFSTVETMISLCSCLYKTDHTQTGCVLSKGSSLTLPYLALCSTCPALRVPPSVLHTAVLFSGSTALGQSQASGPVEPASSKLLSSSEKPLKH